MTEGDAGAQPFSLGSATAATCHFGGSPGILDENELFRIEIELGVEPSFAPFQDVGTVLLGERDPVSGEKSADRRHPNREAKFGKHRLILAKRRIGPFFAHRQEKRRMTFDSAER